MHLALREALKRDQSRSFVAIDLGLPDATSSVCHISDRGIATPSVFYAPRVVRAGLGKSGASVSERTSGLAAREFQIELEDAAGDFRSLVARYSNRLRRSTVTARIGVPEVDASDWCPHFTGLLDSWDRSGPASWTLQCTCDDLPLQAKFPKHPFLASDWPLCAPDILGKFAPIVVGVHNSNGVQSASGTGMVPTYPVDSALYRHVISLGKLRAVVPVYGDGVAISASDYSIVYVTTASGRVWTCVQFNVSTHEAKTITVDCEGLTDKGDGTGAVISNPVRQLQLLLANFVFGDWKSGDWLTPTILDLPAWWEASLYADRKGFEGSLYYGGGQDTGQAAVDAWGSWGIKPLWSGEGKIALAVLDHSAQEYSGDAVPWVRGRGDLRTFKLSTGTRQILSEVTVQYLPSAADGRTFESLKLRDLDVLDEAPASLSMGQSAARRN
jgi:hypothetical protein